VSREIFPRTHIALGRVNNKINRFSSPYSTRDNSCFPQHLLLFKNIYININTRKAILRIYTKNIYIRTRRLGYIV
jgi:hypothetical protein